jgi:hypothetical protein
MAGGEARFGADPQQRGERRERDEGQEARERRDLPHFRLLSSIVIGRCS